MAPFAFPTARDPQQAEELWRATRRYAAETTRGAIADTRIRALVWVRAGRTGRAIVGESFPETGGMVMAILQAPSGYLVCTPTHGFLRGRPVVVDPAHVVRVELFDPPTE